MILLRYKCKSKVVILELRLKTVLVKLNPKKLRFYMKNGLFCAIFGSICVFSFVEAAPSFRQDQDLPQAGIKIRVMSTARPLPLVQPKTYPFTLTRGDERQQLDFFDIHELWWFSQAVGSWRDTAGNLLLLGCPTFTLPVVEQVVQDKFVLRADYEAAVAKQPTFTSETGAEALIPWVEQFSGNKPLSVRPVTCSSFQLAAVVEFVCEAQDWLIYGFRMKRASRDEKGGAGLWNVVAVKIADKTPLVRVRKDFELNFLGSVAASSSPVPKGKVVALTKQAAVVEETKPENANSRDAAHKSIAHLKGWWAADTTDYVFLSDLKSANGKSLIRDLQADLPALRRAFVKMVPPYGEMKDVAIVRIFDAKSDYERYVGPAMAWSIGCWSPLRRELCAVSQGQDKASKEATLKILRHEAFRQYLFYASEFRPSSIWFNEGYACFFEVAEIDSQGRVSVGVNPGLLDILLYNIDGVLPLIPEMIKMDEMASEKLVDRELLAQRYALAWAIVYFLQRAELLEKNGPYAKILATYRASWAETKNPAEASKQAFSNIEMTTFQADFCAFWRKNGRSLRPLRIVDRP